MAYITRYGSLFGTVPPSTGTLYFIAPSASYVVDGRTYSASDDNDGLSPERALRTIGQFVTLATANQGDTALLLEGTHALTARANVNKAGLTLLGISGQYGSGNKWARKSIVSANGNGVTALNIGASNIELGYLEVRTAAGHSGISFSGASNVSTTNTGFDGTYIHDCTFKQTAVSVNSGNAMIDFIHRVSSAAQGGARFLNIAGINTAYIENCAFWVQGAGQAAIVIGSANVHVKGCHFKHTAEPDSVQLERMIQIATRATTCLIEDCVFQTSSTVTVFIEGTDADTDVGVAVRNCDFIGRFTDMSKPIDNFTATTNWLGELVLANCYVLTASGGGFDPTVTSGAQSAMQTGYRGITLIT